MGHLSATDLADYLVSTYNEPFRLAHNITGRLVALAESRGKDLSELSLEELKSIDSRFDEGALSALSLEASKEARKSSGGTSNESVEKQLVLINDFLAKAREF